MDLSVFSESEHFAFYVDTEEDQVRKIGIACHNGGYKMIDFDFSKDSIISFLCESKALFLNRKATCVFFGVNEQYKVLIKNGFEIRNKMFDVKTALHYIDSRKKKKKLFEIVEEIFDYKLDPESTKHKAYSLLKLKDHSVLQLKKLNAYDFFIDTEMEVCKHLLESSMFGIKVDFSKLLEKYDEM